MRHVAYCTMCGDNNPVNFYKCNNKYQQYCKSCKKIKEVRNRLKTMPNEQKLNKLAYYYLRYSDIELIATYFSSSKDEIIYLLDLCNAFDFGNDSISWCLSCQAFKPVTEFYKASNRKNKCQDWCTSCRKEHYDNVEKDKHYGKHHYHKHRDEYLQYQKEYYQNNKERFAEYVIRRKRHKNQACPLWADKQKIREVYKQAHELTMNTGVQYHVDHIIPLQHELVCGLHVENNLQILTQEENISKNNMFQPIIE